MDKNSKLRPLYIAKILYELTDEDHCLSTPEIISILESEYGITGYRTTIAADIELLTEFGMDIEVIKSSSNMYHMVLLASGSNSHKASGKNRQSAAEKYDQFSQYLVPTTPY